MHTVIKIIQVLTVLAAIVGIAAGLTSMYEKIWPGDELIIEQRLSPEMMKQLKNGAKKKKKKGITIEEPVDDTGS